MKSAVARLQAVGMFQTTAMRNSALTSIVWLGSNVIPEEDQKIYLAISDLCSDLLISPQRAAL